jgi:uncharacterized phage protein (TIGR01671 family)
MREIKFRGKRLHDNNWIIGNLCVDNQGIKHIIPFDDMEEDGHHLRIDSDLPVFFNEETVGQFTGLKDKYGVDIYEGDKFKSDDDCYEYFQVNWDNEEARFQIDAYGYEIYQNEGRGEEYSREFALIDDNILDMSCVSVLEIIGNIHEK